MGVYLIHEHCLNVKFWPLCINAQEIPGQVLQPLLILFYFVLLVFVVCVVIEWFRIMGFKLLSQITPFQQIGNVLTKFCKKVDQKVNEIMEG